jgi:hypothetical protein
VPGFRRAFALAKSIAHAIWHAITNGDRDPYNDASDIWWDTLRHPERWDLDVYSNAIAYADAEHWRAGFYPDPSLYPYSDRDSYTDALADVCDRAKDHTTTDVH